MKRSASLDSWREYFKQREDSNIFEIIDHANMVAAADFPEEFKSKRRCIRCDHHLETVGVATKLNENQIVSNNTDREASVNVDEVMRIKAILLNKENERDSVILKSLKKLESMSMNVEILGSTEIGKAVNGVKKHSSDEISKLAKTLLAVWKKLFNQWCKTAKEVSGDDESPNSVLDKKQDEKEDEEEFPFPPHDLDFIEIGSTEFDLSQILDGIDSDGNLCDNLEPKHERNLKSSPKGSPNVVKKNNKDQHNKKEEADKRKSVDPDAKIEPAKQKLEESTNQKHENAKRQRTTVQVVDTIPIQSRGKRPQIKKHPLDNLEFKHERNLQSSVKTRPEGTNDQHTKKEEAGVRTMKNTSTDLDDRRRQPKQTRDQIVHENQIKPLVGSQDNKPVSLDIEAKIESTKQKLQEGYQKHENAKRQRSIQIVETIPKQSRAKRSQFKKPMRR